MKDRESVKKMIGEFLKTVSYVGYTDGFDVEKLTQVFRRIYKSPEDVEIDTLLDFAMVLAISNSPYEEYDSKSKKFIIDTLDFIEDQYKGYKSIEQETTTGNIK